MKRVLITGANGQLGWELQQTLPLGFDAVAMSSQQLDITDSSLVKKKVAELQPALVINAAAYTAVDKAESDKERAFAVNAEGAANLARAAREQNARMIQVSTDYVFDGSQSTPYEPETPVSPLGVYGESKYAGEQAVREILGEQCLILRTGWVYSAHGQNFVKTMLRLMAERDELGVVVDQAGTPTHARGLARVIWDFALKEECTGVFHWSDAGVASWYDFALAIRDEALGIHLLEKRTRIRPIRSAEYPTPAARPSYSVLDKSSTWEALAITPRHWRDALKDMLLDMMNYDIACEKQ